MIAAENFPYWQGAPRFNQRDPSRRVLYNYALLGVSRYSS